MPNNQKTVAVIGSGIGGLAIALRLNKMGFKVHVFETNNYPGGKLTSFNIGEYRFDAGPSLFTLPQLVTEIVELYNLPNTFKYKKLSSLCYYFWDDGTFVNAFAQSQLFANEIEQKLGVNPQLVHKVLKNSAFIYNHIGKIFTEKSLHKLSTWFSKSTFKALLMVYKYGLFKTMNNQNAQTLKNQKLIQLFNRYATYNGSNPYKAPAVLNVIPHLEHNLGAYLPEKGMHQITETLYQLALKNNVTFSFNQSVNHIVYKNKRATGIKVNNTFLPFDVIVSNMDIAPTYKKLLPNLGMSKKILAQERSSSALIFYWGIKKTFANLHVHNIFFANNYQEEFTNIFNKQTIGNDLTVYVNITSKMVKPDAPEGSENWFVMVNAPANIGQNWDTLIKNTRQHILNKLSNILQTPIEPLIEVEEVLDPRKIELKTSSFKGSLYGTSSNSKLSAFMRHPNFSNQLKNLYFVGGSVHPGGGIPLCLNSAKITAQLIHQNHA